MPRVMRPKPTLASTLIQGNRPLSWNTIAFSTAQPGASTLMVPLVSCASPARMRSRVDFPQPEGPTMQRNSPGATFRSMSSSATTRPAPLTYSLRNPTMSIAAPRRSTAISATAGELAVLVLEHERPELAARVRDIAGVDHPFGREFAIAHLVLEKPGLHVEHAGDIDLAIRAACRPGIFVQQFRAGFGAGADREIDQRLPGRAAVIGLTIIADGAQIGDVVIAHQLAVGLGEIGVDHAHRDGERVRLDGVVGVLEVDRVSAVEQLRGERRDGDRGVDRLVVERDGVLRERNDLDVHVVDGEPVRFQELAHLVGRYRALAVGGDGLALELAQLGDLALEVGPQHQIVPERARDAVEHHGDRQVLLQRVEVAGGDSAFDQLQLVLREQRNRIRGSVERLGDDLDAVLLEVALLDRPQDGGGGNRAHRADLDGELLGLSRASADGEEARKQATLKHRSHSSSPLGRLSALFGWNEIASLAVAIEAFLA